ncbi:MAG: hypothetical protein J6N52_10160 [Clostridia bacterium]|nr:hypothetical protein [Clostridia bacterium]
MSKPIKYSVPKQIRSLTFTHLCCDFVMTFLAFTFLGLADKHIAVKIILNIILIAIYFMWIFASAYECATSDHKHYTPLTPYPAKGALLSTGIIILTAAVWIYYFLAWKLMPMGETFVLPTFISTVLYIFITSPFFGLVNVSGGSANIIGQICTLIIPFAACTFGYFCGYKKWDYTKYMKVLMFEKKK